MPRRIKSNTHSSFSHDLDQAESDLEIPSTSAEILMTSAESGSETADSTDTTPFMDTVSVIPLIGDFVRGISFSLQAMRAINNPIARQRKTKIAAGIFGAAVSLGAAIVGSLVLAGVGLLGTASAIAIAPIVLASAVVGVYAVALYRDIYRYIQLKKEIEEYNINTEKFISERPPLTAEQQDEIKRSKLIYYPQKIKQARKNIITNIIGTIAFTLLLGAVFATGVGAIALSATAGVMIIGSTAKHMYDHHLSFRQAAFAAGIFLLTAAAFSTGIGAIILSTIGIVAVAVPVLQSLMEAKETAKKPTRNSDEISSHHETALHHTYLPRTESAQPNLKHKEDVKQTVSRPLSTSHQSLFEHKERKSDEKDTPTNPLSNRPHRDH